jgi:DNA topoisomerase IA
MITLLDISLERYLLIVDILFPLIHTLSNSIQISPDCKYKVTTLIFEIGSEIFSVSGKTLLDPGFTRCMHWAALAPEEQMPDLKFNQLHSIYDV